VELVVSDDSDVAVGFVRFDDTVTLLEVVATRPFLGAVT